MPAHKPLASKRNHLLRLISALGVVGVIAALTSVPAGATHSWGNYHWARTANPFTLQLVDSVTTAWDSYLGTASTDWSVSTVLDTRIVPGDTSNATTKRCPAVLGKDRVCNALYGNTGWLGLAQIWVYADGHIAQGTVKLNDTYFNTATYNTPAWRKLVMCQEVGHTFGLAHQDENFSNTNLGSCMDYTNDPDGTLANPDQLSNEHPNQADFDELVCKYAVGPYTGSHPCASTGHLDTSTTLAASVNGSGPGRGQDLSAEAGNTPAEWGVPVKNRADGRPILYGRDLGAGRTLFTWVTWADSARR